MGPSVIPTGPRLPCPPQQLFRPRWLALVYDARAMLSPEAAHVAEVCLSLSFLICTMGVASPPPRVGLRTGGSSTRDVPRKVPACPGLGGRGLATSDPLPLLSWLLWDQGWLSGRLHVHFCLEDYISTLGHGVWGFEPWGPALRWDSGVQAPSSMPASPRHSWEEKCYSWGQTGSHSHSFHPENPLPPPRDFSERGSPSPAM